MHSWFYIAFPLFCLLWNVSKYLLRNYGAERYIYIYAYVHVLVQLTTWPHDTFLGDWGVCGLKELWPRAHMSPQCAATTHDAKGWHHASWNLWFTACHTVPPTDHFGGRKNTPRSISEEGLSVSNKKNNISPWQMMSLYFHYINTNLFQQSGKRIPKATIVIMEPWSWQMNVFIHLKPRTYFKFSCTSKVCMYVQIS